MIIRHNRLATALLRIFQGLRILCIIGAVVLIPTLLFAWAFPGSIQPGGTMRVNGLPMDGRPNIAPTLLLYGNILVVASALTLTQLIGLMRSVVRGAPFVPANVGRLRVVAGILAALFVLKASTGLVIGSALRRSYAIDGGSFDFGLFLGALTVLVLAEVFREGVRLSDDAAGTI